MKHLYAHLKAYLFLKKNYIRKKFHTYSLAFQVAVDRTSAIYVGALLLYLLVSFLLYEDTQKILEKPFLRIEELAKSYYFHILTILPITYVVKAFRNPGVYFSSAEQKLSLLPYSRKTLWLFSFAYRWLKHFLIFGLIGLLAVLFTPLSGTVMLMYLGLSLGGHLLFTLPQWRLFQQHVAIKIGINLIVLGIPLLNLLPLNVLIIVLCLLIFLLLCINIYLFRNTLFKDVNWRQVIEVSDFHAWNTPLISQVSKVKMERPKGISLFQRLFWRRRPFRYKDQPIYHRLWQIYFGKHFSLVFRSVGAIFVILFVFTSFGEIYFHIVVGVSVYMYSAIAKHFFIERFTFDMIEVLPWELEGYKQSFLDWVLMPGLLFFLPIAYFGFKHPSIWFPFQVLYFGGVLVYFLKLKINEAIYVLQRKVQENNVKKVIGYLLWIGIFMSAFTPYIYFIGLFLPFFSDEQKGAKV